MIKAVIFDFDGLIIDTETPWYEIFYEIYKEHGASLPLELWAKCVGSSDEYFDPYGYLQERIKRPVDRDGIRKLSEERHSSTMKKADLRPGVREYLKSAKSMGIKVGVASSSDRGWVEGYLRRFSLMDYFDSICTREDVTIVKPDPEIYLKAMERLGVKGHEAIAFEDSPNGAMAAKRAGLYCVVVPNDITKRLSFTEYDSMIKSMAETSLESVIKRFE